MSNIAKTNAAYEALKKRAQELSVLSPLMKDREKGETEMLLGQVSTIIDYGFIEEKPGDDYVIFVVKERPKTFFFGGMVLTDVMHKLDADGMGDVIRENGIPVRFEKKKSRTKDPVTGIFQSYTNAILFPED